MAPSLFITGATGYIGGDALSVFHTKHPDWSYTCLVRNSDKGALVVAKYPSVRLVYGDLASVDLVTAESARADIVCHFADCDDEPSAKAIIAGLAQHDAGSPGYLIHTSGSAILCYPDMDRKTFGDAASKTWDDVKDIDEINAIPRHALHREVDKIVLESGLNVAIVCPPTIYGEGRGEGNQRSVQLPALIATTLTRKKGFMVNEGKTFWPNVHVHDLSQLYLLLAEDAAADGEKATWGGKGYYFVENGEHVWGEVSRAVAQAGKKAGLLDSDEVDALSVDEIRELHPFGQVIWGANSRCTATRARKELGWSPRAPSLEESIKPTLDLEAAKLRPGHAEVAAGDA